MMGETKDIVLAAQFIIQPVRNPKLVVDRRWPLVLNPEGSSIRSPGRTETAPLFPAYGAA
jgi:hypothetical protein